ncbi:MAG: hypothetical protein R3B91_19975 [Planctomycetaceae bacterium]
MRRIALATGFVDHPSAERWHQRPTALMGGVAIVFGVGSVCWWWGSIDTGFRTILGATGFLAVIGLLDDALPLKPYQKLAGQLAAAAAIIYAGYSVPWTGSAVFNIGLTVLWLVGITNAVNLLDNMDGLAGGIAAIAAAFLGINFAMNGQPTEAVVLFSLAAGLVAFLVYNFQPASIFMGDCGAMSVGFFLASAGLLAATGGRSRSVLSVLAVPVMILLIPIFDTTLVTILRSLAGKSVARGWNDHTSHRLVALGLSERHAVLLMWGLAAASGLASLLVRDFPVNVGIAILASLLLGFTLLGIHLGDVKIFSEEDLRAARKRPLVSLLHALSFKRRVFEMALDVVLFVMSYYLACAFLYGTGEDNPTWLTFRQTIALLVTLRLMTFLTLGVYRGIWKYISLDDAMRYAKAIAIGSILTAFFLKFILPLPVYGSVLVLDGVIAFVLIAGSRMTFLVFGRMLPQNLPTPAKRVLIYGAGDSGTMLLRLMHSDPKRPYEVVGFLDDDPFKSGMTIHGLPVFHTREALDQLVTKLDAHRLIVSSEKIPSDHVYELLDRHPRLRIETYRLHVELEALSREPMMAAG